MLAAAAGLVGVQTLTSDRLALRASARASSRRRVGVGVGGPFLMLAVLFLVGVYAASMMVVRMLSRYRELAADRGAVALTGAPSTLAAALVKISDAIDYLPTTDLRMTDGMNQFFILPGPTSFSGWLATHPPLDVRLVQLRSMERELEAV